MADELDSQNIARHSFEVRRRGYEQQEVRAFLHQVSSLVERLQREAVELRDRAELAEGRLRRAEGPDEAMLLEVLGEETTRVLVSAREAAEEIRAKAEASAERIITDATAQAGRTRDDALREAERRLAEAKAEAEAVLGQAREELARRQGEAEEEAGRIRDEAAAQAQDLRDEVQRHLDQMEDRIEADLEAARAEGRELVVEAQAVRERVLRDLTVRRKKARQQVEKLNAGRERLLQAYEVVRRTIDEATDELSTSLSDARLAADAAARRIEEEPDPSMEQLDEEVATAGLVDLPIAEHDDHDDSPGPFSGEVPVADVDPVPAADSPSPSVGAPVDEGAVPEVEEGADPAAETPGPVVAAVGEPDPVAVAKATDRAPMEEPTAPPPEDLFSPMAPVVSRSRGSPRSMPAQPAAPGEGVRILAEPALAEDTEAAPELEVAVEEPKAPASAEDEAPTVEDLFARLRADRESEGVDSGDPEPDTPEAVAPETAAPTPFDQRDEELSAIEKELGRRLKRALADEQNEVLDLLRRVKPRGVGDLLPNEDDHAGHWADAAKNALVGAARAGATWAGGKPGPVADLADELARALTGPMRDRVDRAFVASDGNLDDMADRVRALYREWKGQRLAETSRHYAAAAYARGIYDGLASDVELRWVVDPKGGPCPDCDDNALGGALPKGTEFPTGHECAPAHAGCRCLVLPAQH